MDTNYEIYNLLGEKVMAGVIIDNQIITQHLENGIYMLRLMGNNAQVFKIEVLH